MKKTITLLFVASLLVLPFSGNAQTYSFDFSPGYEGWSGDFAEYPVVDSVFYELEFSRMPLPLPLDTQQYSLMITGNNHSDDLSFLPAGTYLLRIGGEEIPPKSVIKK